MLDIETTNVLILKAKNGDEESKSILINENSPLIKSVIKKSHLPLQVRSLFTNISNP